MFDLSESGIDGELCSRNLSAPVLVEQAILAKDARLNVGGALVVETGKYTGRSPNDKFIVLDDTTKVDVSWGKVNQSISPDDANKLYLRICDYLKGKKLYVQDCFAGAQKQHRLPIRVICERAWHALFAQNMFISPSEEELLSFSAGFTVVHAPGFKADPKTDKTNSEVAVVLDFHNRRVMICGTEYAGEIKKSIFTVMNHLLPAKNILGMHCSANVGKKGDVAIFFGLSGTGKTTLSADPNRMLIGDDEHGWCDDGVFNFEGGCYAKVIRLNEKDEPAIFSTTRKFGTILENVEIDSDKRTINLDSDRLTENTRASYGIEQIGNAVSSGVGKHPNNILMLTCDAFGVLPPIARLTPEQAMYHFMSGYTARVAGTERGVTEPTAVFSACFGAPFMTRFPGVYAKLLGERMKNHKSECWLVNTGWTGGPYGVGERMKISWTRRLIEAALNGELSGAKWVKDERFGFEIPMAVEGVPSEILFPRNVWKDKGAFDKKADHLARQFVENFREFEAETERAIVIAAPKPLYPA